MKKKVISLFVLASMFYTAHAQISITPEVGLGANVRSNLIHKWNPSIKVGASVDFPISSHFAVESGLFYNLRTYSDISGTFSNNSVTWNEDITVKRHQLQVPIMGKFSWKLNDSGLSFFCGAGIYIGGYVSNNISRDRKVLWQNSENGDLYEMLIGKGYNNSGRSNDEVFHERYSADKGFDWGVMGNIGVEKNRLMVKVGYDLSLSKESSIDKISPNYHTITLSAGYRFNFNRLFK